MNTYRSRVYDTVLSQRLEASGAVLIEGPKWCGKTTTAAHTAQSSVYFQDPQTRNQSLTLVDLEPQELLKVSTFM